MKTNKTGTNSAIKAHILDDSQMREVGFTDFCKDKWYFCKNLGDDISFNVTIPKNGDDIEIITLDENFLQPYDYQTTLKRNPEHSFALQIKEKVEEWMEYLQKNGVLSGHIREEYI